jgi:hypothetical protein
MAMFATMPRPVNGLDNPDSGAIPGAAFLKPARKRLGTVDAGALSLVVLSLRCGFSKEWQAGGVEEVRLLPEYEMLPSHGCGEGGGGGGVLVCVCVPALGYLHQLTAELHSTSTPSNMGPWAWLGWQRRLCGKSGCVSHPSEQGR